MRLGDAAPLEKLFPPDFPNPSATLKRITDERMHDWMRHYHDKTAAIPGSIELLHELHGQGVQLGIATSSGRALPFLDHWGVRHLFRGLSGGKMLRTVNRIPSQFLNALTISSLPLRRVIYVGDSIIDIRAGKAAGVATVGVLHGHEPAAVHQEGPDHILESVATLLHLWRKIAVEFFIESLGCRSIEENMAITQ